VLLELVNKRLNEELGALEEERRKHLGRYREQQVQLCERNIATLQPRADAGDMAAHDRLIRWSDRLSRYLGLDLRPPDVQINTGPTLIIADPFPAEDPPVDGEATEAPPLPCP